MKLSISIPDELWDSARQVLHTHTSASAIVQEALRRAVAEGTTRPEYADAVRDAETSTAIAEVRSRLVEEARMTYQSGYRSGIALAQQLSWQQIDWITKAPVDIRARAKEVHDFTQKQMVDPDYIPAGTPFVDPDLLGEYLGTLAHPLLEWNPEPVAIEGITAALTDIRTSVESNPPGGDSTPPTATR